MSTFLKRHSPFLGILVMFLLAWMRSNPKASFLLPASFYASFHPAGIFLPVTHQLNPSNKNKYIVIAAGPESQPSLSRAIARE